MFSPSGHEFFALQCAGWFLQPCLPRNAFGQPLDSGGNLVDHPMNPRFRGRRIGIVANQYQFLGAFGHARPRKRRGNIGPFARVFLGDRMSLGKSRTGQFHRHHFSSFQSDCMVRGRTATASIVGLPTAARQTNAHRQTKRETGMEQCFDQRTLHRTYSLYIGPFD